MTPSNSSTTADQLGNRLIEEFEQALKSNPGLEPASFLQAHPDAPSDVLPSLEVLRLLSITGHRGVGFPCLPPGLEGRILGDFEILREVGRGGMGIVYEARQKHLERTVALKVLPFLASDDARRVKRFRNEVRLASQLEHPHIVPIHSFGQENGIHYYSMRFIHGKSLSSWMEQNRGKPRTSELVHNICLWISQAALAVHHAHQEGILHRDLKPANLLVDADDNLWVTDFGLACRPDEAGLTLTGDLVGTLRFMSPELLLGTPSPPDPRSDIYSLGITLFELIADKPAFREPNQNALIQKITQGDSLQINQVIPGLPEPLTAIVNKAMAQDKEDRYQSARDFGEDLQRFCNGQSVLAKPLPPLRRMKKWLARHRAFATTVGAALGLGIVAGLAISFSWIWGAYSNEKIARGMVEEREKTTLQILDDMQVFSERVIKHSPELWERHHDFLKRMVTNLNEIADEPGASCQLRLQAAKAAHHLGELLAFRGNQEAAREQFATAVNRLKTLERDFPQNQQIEFQLVQSIQSSGWDQKATDASASQKAYAREVESRFGRLASRFPDNISFQNSWAEACLNRGRAYLDNGEQEQAIPWLEKAHQINSGLRDRFPDATKHPLSYIRLGNTLQFLALAYESQGMYQEAENALRQAVSANDVLAREQPNPVRDRQATGSASSRLGILLGSLGQLEEAEKCLQQALVDTRDLARLESPSEAIILARIRAADHLVAIRHLLGRKGEHAQSAEIQKECQSLPFFEPRLEGIVHSLVLNPIDSSWSQEKMRLLLSLLESPLAGMDLALGLSLVRQGKFESATHHLISEIQSANAWSDLATVYLALAKHRMGKGLEGRELLAALSLRYPQLKGLNPITRLALKEVRQEMDFPANGATGNP